MKTNVSNAVALLLLVTSTHVMAHECEKHCGYYTCYAKNTTLQTKFTGASIISKERALEYALSICRHEVKPTLSDACVVISEAECTYTLRI